MLSEFAQQLLHFHWQGKNVGYNWDWSIERQGSWVPDDPQTTLQRYKLDLGAMIQRNASNGVTRTISRSLATS